MKESVLTSVVLPLSLFLIMLGMGMSLVASDFKRVLLYPKAVALGLLSQMVLLPLVGFGLAIAFGLSPLLAVGLMLIAACPGGVTSNLIAHVSRADTALSITLTAINSFLAVVTLPLIMAFSIEHFMGQSQSVQLPVLKTIGQVVAITVFPVSIGMAIRHKALEFAQRMERASRIASTVVFVLILVGIIAANIQVIKDHFLALSGVTLALNLITMGLGFGLAKLGKLARPQQLTIAIESGIQNGTLAIVVATTILKNGEIALPGGVYSLVMFVTGGLIMGYFGRKNAEAAPQAASA